MQTTLNLCICFVFVWRYKLWIRRISIAVFCFSNFLSSLRVSQSEVELFSMRRRYTCTIHMFVQSMVKYCKLNWRIDLPSIHKSNYLHFSFEMISKLRMIVTWVSLYFFHILCATQNHWPTCPQTILLTPHFQRLQNETRQTTVWNENTVPHIYLTQLRELTCLSRVHLPDRCTTLQSLFLLVSEIIQKVAGASSTLCAIFLALQSILRDKKTAHKFVFLLSTFADNAYFVYRMRKKIV